MHLYLRLYFSKQLKTTKPNRRRKKERKKEKKRNRKGKKNNNNNKTTRKETPEAGCRKPDGIDQSESKPLA